jgi:hypothetical protein
MAKVRAGRAAGAPPPPPPAPFGVNTPRQRAQPERPPPARRLPRLTHASPPSCQTIPSPPPHPQDLVADCPAAKELFDKASGILGYDLLQVGGG